MFPENPGYVLRLSEEEWQEHQANAMFAGLKISYTMDDGTYVVRLTDEQYEEYKKNSGTCSNFIYFSFKFLFPVLINNLFRIEFLCIFLHLPWWHTTLVIISGIAIRKSKF